MQTGLAADVSIEDVADGARGWRDAASTIAAVIACAMVAEMASAMSQGDNQAAARASFRGIMLLLHDSRRGDDRLSCA